VNAQVSCPNVFKCGTNFVDPRDGISYSTVQIGTQCWFQVSLQATKYLNGDSIPHITNATKWYSLTTGAWCDYNNLTSNGITYGHMYTWYAVNDSRGLCPRGWYVPTNKEWTVLANFLGGVAVAGTAMKANSALWSANTGTNKSGFTGLPGGFRNSTDGFAFMGNVGHHWSALSSPSGADDCALQDVDANAFVDSGSGMANGFSVRCMKDY
jgi:uncharacterized protein (TIGR02145 family)